MKSAVTNSSMRQAFADSIYQLASDDPQLYVVSADLRSSFMLDRFAGKFRSRFIECGVAENNAAGIAAGLAKSGKHVYLCSFACFSPAINWAVIKQSILYNQLNVKIIGSHAGLMSSDLGATHQMLEDIALTRPLPGLDVFAPLDSQELLSMIPVIHHSPRSAYIRLVRPAVPNVFHHNVGFTIGKSNIISSGNLVTVLGFGPVLNSAINSKIHGLDIINLSSIKPLDEKTIITSVKKTGKLIIIEDHQRQGGVGEAVSHLLLSNNIKTQFIHLAVDNQFGFSSPDYLDLYRHFHLDSKSFDSAVNLLLKK